MTAAAANLSERVLPPSTPLRPWVLTVTFPWRPRLAQHGELLGRLTQIFVETVQAFYAHRAAKKDPGCEDGCCCHCAARNSSRSTMLPKTRIT